MQRETESGREVSTNSLQPQPEPGFNRNPLTPRECEVLSTIAGGFDSKTVAEGLCVSPRTVEFHLSQAYRKLGAKNRVQAINIATQRGLIARFGRL